MCDDKPNILLVAESSQGHLFGGFTSVPWRLENRKRVRDDKAFLFSLTHDTVHHIIGDSPAVEHTKEGYIAIFGHGGLEDLYIYDNCDQNINSSSKLGHAFELPPNISDPNSAEAMTYLAGRHIFRVNELEAFQVDFL